MLDTARECRDNELALLPGYRDRVVDIELRALEGGLNLDMPKSVIGQLAERGRLAAILLAARFGPEAVEDPKTGDHVVLNWDNHRWVRLRSFMAAMELTLVELRSGWAEGGKSAPPPASPMPTCWTGPWRGTVAIPGKMPKSVDRRSPACARY